MGDHSVSDRAGLLQNELTNSNLVNSHSLEVTVSTEELGQATAVSVQADPTLYNVEESTEEERPLVLYKRRWYILVIFALISATQGGVFATWGPIATSAQIAFGWDEHTIALLANWGLITYTIGTPFFAWLVGDKGIRPATVLTAGLITLGTGLRCISANPPLVTWFAHVGQMLNGLAGPVSYGATTVVSATWFPASQRTTATAIGTIFNGLGCAVPYLLGPFVVPEPQVHNITNGTVLHHQVQEIRSCISHLMYLTFGWSALLFIAVLLYFPSKPPSPPSRTASLDRLQFSTGLKRILRNKQLWILSLSFAVPTGFSTGMSSILDSDLSVIGVSQISAGWMGFLSMIIGNLCALILGIFSDTFTKRMKVFVLVCYSLSLSFLIVFVCIYLRVLPNIKGLLWVSYCVYSIGIWATAPVFFELAAEVNYPVAEGTSHGFVAWLSNLLGMIFLLILLIPSLDTSWIHWSLIGSLVVAIPLMGFFRENYSRLNIDSGNPAKHSGNTRAYLHGSVTPHPLYN